MGPEGQQLAPGRIGPGQTCEGVIVMPCREGELILRHTPAGASTEAHRTRVAPFEILAGPDGTVVYGGFGPVHGFRIAGQDLNLQVAPWGGEGPMYLWRRPDGQVWLATVSWDGAREKGYILLRPFGETERCLPIERPAAFVTCVDHPGGQLIVASCDNVGRASIDVLPADAALVKLPASRPAVTVNTRRYQVAFLAKDPRYGWHEHPGNCDLLYERVDANGDRLPEEDGAAIYRFAIEPQPGVHKTPKPTFASTFVAPHVPAHLLRGILFSLEGGVAALDDPTRAARFEAQLEESIELAIRLKVPLVTNLDGDDWRRPVGAALARRYLRKRPGLEMMAMFECYPHRLGGTFGQLEGIEPIPWSVARWRETHAAVKALGFERVVIARSMYTQLVSIDPWLDNYPISHILALQPVITQLCNEWQVAGDFWFAWARRGGVVDYSEALLPWAEALGAATPAELPDLCHPAVQNVLQLTTTITKGPAPLKVPASVLAASGAFVPGVVWAWRKMGQPTWTEVSRANLASFTFDFPTAGQYEISAVRVAADDVLGDVTEVRRVITVDAPTAPRRPSRIPWD
jgi:hypothetical protein